MSATILWWAVAYGQFILSVALCLAMWRTLKGPRAQDRVLGLDTMYIIAMLLLIVTGVRVNSVYFFEGALVIGVLGFVSTVALAKFLLRGEVIE